MSHGGRCYRRISKRPGGSPKKPQTFTQRCVWSRHRRPVLWTLRDGPLRPRELQDRIGGISHKVLNETLRRLEQNGLITRRRYAEAPPRVEYELTGPGRGMLEPLFALSRWTELYADEVLDAQERALSDR